MLENVQRSELAAGEVLLLRTEAEPHWVRLGAPLAQYPIPSGGGGGY